jgi:hypothetical protein
MMNKEQDMTPARTTDLIFVLTVVLTTLAACGFLFGWEADLKAAALFGAALGGAVLWYRS